MQLNGCMSLQPGIFLFWIDQDFCGFKLETIPLPSRMVRI